MSPCTTNIWQPMLIILQETLMYCEPPFEETYKSLKKCQVEEMMVEECELPLIDLSGLHGDSFERGKCMKEIGEAAREWGFFQVVNHGVSKEVLERMREEQMEVFKLPFLNKTQPNFLNLSGNSYRWGNPKATRVDHFFWSETFHVSLKDISTMNGCDTLRCAVDEFATKMGSLAEEVAGILGQNLGVKFNLFAEMCPRESSYVRMNRYPPCPFSSEVFGLLPHTDSDFLTLLYQDNIGGLQLLRHGTWFSVNPNPQALIINIGDLFQALSNGEYKSIKHRVVAQQEAERFSLAYFYCPSKDAVIESCTKPAVYRRFSFQEYKDQIYKDVQETGNKIGLSRFLL